MKRRIKLDKVIANNPYVDKAQLEEALEAIRTLREQGITDHQYDLEPIFLRQPPHKRPEITENPPEQG